MNNSLGRALIIGMLLAIGAVGLFLLFYYVVFAGYDALVQLLGSLCIPPAVLFFLVSGYYILTNDADNNMSDTNTDDD